MDDLRQARHDEMRQVDPEAGGWEWRRDGFAISPAAPAATQAMSYK
jgi:hypothetical protein